MSIDPKKRYLATLKTNLGDMQVELHAADAPGTVNNFVFLARQGFYDGVPFHRVIKGFMVQTGDPTGTGTGGPGYRIKDEPVKGEYTRGTMAMARTAAPDSAGSQFFIMHQDYGLAKQYVIFGHLVAGQDVLDRIASVPVQASPGNPTERSSPTQEVRIQSVEITEQ
ncbi:MAG: peptidylprolyl isomerase [Chloroflexi bacterium]|nr:peptidylprolyl isomerase [Chloroflexota bacterium]